MRLVSNSCFGRAELVIAHNECSAQYIGLVVLDCCEVIAHNESSAL